MSQNAQMTAEEQARHIFWIILTGADQEYKDIKIDHLVLTELLYQAGFRRYDIEDTSIFIRIINDRIIRQVKIQEMQDYIYDYIEQLPDELNEKWGTNIKKAIKKKVHSGVTSIFNVQKLYILRPKDPIEFNQDTLTEKYIYFKNGVLKVSALKIDFIPYSYLKGYVWENEIIQREYTAPRRDDTKNYVKRFFWLVSGQDQKRFEDLQIAAGYYTHDFYEYKLRAMILTDSTISDENEANGRTGKTLFCRLIGGMISHNSEDPSIKTYVEINAKDFDPREKFKYSSCALETKLIVLNDLKRNFDVDCVYNDVTEGVDVNRKGLHPFKIRAKMILTTNKTVKLSGDSDTDRFMEFEFSSYFSKNHAPDQEFGHWFFRDWSSEDYNRYYQFMAECVQLYFKNGGKLREPKQINLGKRKLIDHTCPEFIEWIEALKVEPGRRYDKKLIYQDFITQFPDYAQLKQKRFREWLISYNNHSGLYKLFKKEENENRDNQSRYIRFISK